YTREELIKMTLADITYIDDLYRDLALFNQVLKGVTDGYRLEKRFIRKGGTVMDTTLWINCRRDDRGDVKYCVALLEDISKRKMLEEEIRLSNEILNHISEGVFLIRAADGTIVYTNPRFDEMFNYSHGELLGKHVSIVNAPTNIDPQETARRIILSIEENGMWQGEILNIKKTGETFWSYASVSTFEHTRYDTVWVAVHMDITERKRINDELKQLTDNLKIRIIEEVKKNRLKDQLMYEQSRHIAMGELLVNIAHQWRQPLTTIGLLVQDIKDAYVHNELDLKYLDNSIKVIMIELTGLSSTIDSFKNFYFDKHERTHINIAVEINKALALLGGYFQESGIVLESELDENNMTYAFPNEISQVILNILNNTKDVFEARRIPNGSIKIKSYKDPGTGKTIIIVADNGGGVRKDIIGHIFDPYFTTKHRSRGTGLGLYISKLIIENHMNGTISIKNTDDGCEVRIEL
ncbi:MAG: PAS domain S-box protein, partial [Candidatus Magnetoovum sp. WYHC-5]|nr:PAS domain S-box protein [Candidatus Magnetoovum sp. WYHC-5]